MQRLDRIWGQRHLSLSTKLGLYTTLVLPVLLYDSGTWTVTKFARLQAIHMRCQRRILGVHWQNHVTNKAIYKRTSQPYIGTTHPSPKALFFWIYCSLTSVCSLQCHTGALQGPKTYPWVVIYHRAGEGQGDVRVSSKGTQGFQQLHTGAALWIVKCGGRTQRPLLATRYDDDGMVIDTRE